MRMPVTPRPTRARGRFVRPASSSLRLAVGSTAALLVASLTSLIAPAAHAQGTAAAGDPQWSLIPTVGWVLTDSNRRAANGLTGSVQLCRISAPLK